MGVVHRGPLTWVCPSGPKARRTVTTPAGRGCTARGQDNEHSRNLACNQVLLHCSPRTDICPKLQESGSQAENPLSSPEKGRSPGSLQDPPRAPSHVITKPQPAQQRQGPAGQPPPEVVGADKSRFCSRADLTSSSPPRLCQTFPCSSLPLMKDQMRCCSSSSPWQVFPQGAPPSPSSPRRCRALNAAGTSVAASEAQPAQTLRRTPEPPTRLQREADE